MTPRDLVWDEVKYEIFCTREEFDETTKDFEFIPTRAGVVMRHGPEVHVFGKFSIRDSKRILKDTIDRFGKATCLCPKREVTGQKLLTMFGFTKVGESDLDYFYEARHE